VGKAARRQRQVQRQVQRSIAAKEEPILHRLVEVAPKHLEALASRTTIECIEAACIGLQVLQRLGISAVERPVAVDLLNPQMADALRAGRDPATLTDADGAWVTSMGHKTGLRTPTQWQGHLVFQATGWLIDLWPVSRTDKNLNLPAAYCLPVKTFPATFSLHDGSLITYYDKPENRFYKLTDTWPNGYPEWRPTVDAIVSEVAVPQYAPKGDALFTRCPDNLGVREYVERVFAVSLPEHITDAAEAMDVLPERILDFDRAVGVLSDTLSRNARRELIAIEAMDEINALGADQRYERLRASQEASTEADA
jgi:hypothetical protein